jgi:SAM-dependent methyltransferase
MPEIHAGERRLSLALASDAGRELRRASAPLSVAERAHLAWRFRSAPWSRVVEAFDTEGSLLDVGCGPGLLAHLLSRAGFDGRYVGVDPDPRKVERARRWLPEGDARRFVAGPVESASPAAFTQAALIDVLYLVPPPERAAFVGRAVRALAPGGLFVALTSGGGPRWKRTLDSVQERLAVGLGITRGGAVAICDGAEIAARFRDAGLVGVAVADAGAGYVHGFELVTGRRPET